MSKHNALPDGTRINHYTIVKFIGSGGFGITYLIEDGSGNRFVLKELFIASGGICQRRADGKVVVNDKDREVYDFAFDRFVDEAKILQQIHHRAIVRVHEHFFANDTVYYVMEYLDGQSLQSYVDEKGKLSEEETISLIFPLLEAVKEMHRLGLWHRDIKPDNMMLSGDRTVLIDFGAVKVTDAQVFSVNREQSLFAAVTKTYAAPEQMENLNLKVDQRADIYALGLTLFFMLTGKLMYPNIETRLIEESKAGKGYIDDILAKYPLGETFRKTIKNCIVFSKEKRYENVSEIQQSLVGSTIVPTPQPEPSPPLSSLSGGGIFEQWYLFLPLGIVSAIGIVMLVSGNTFGWVLIGLSLGAGGALIAKNGQFGGSKESVSRYVLTEVTHGEQIYLEKGKSYKLGRDPACDIVVSPEYAYVSREHLMLTCEDDTIVVRELKETQGTYINGAQIKPNIDYVWDSTQELMLVNGDCVYRWEAENER